MNKWINDNYYIIYKNIINTYRVCDGHFDERCHDDVGKLKTYGIPTLYLQGCVFD